MACADTAALVCGAYMDNAALILAWKGILPGVNLRLFLWSVYDKIR